MKERTLQSLLSRLVILALPLAAEAGCGGAASVDDGAGAQDSGGSGGAGTGGVGMGGAPATGGAATGGVSTGGVSTGGVSTGGVATGGTGTGGTATGGVATGGAATGGVSTGGVSTGGVSTGGGTTGGTATGGGGGSTGCSIPSNFSVCTQPRSAAIPRSCVTGTLTTAQCQAICGMLLNGTCQSLGETETTITIQCPPACVAGRRPPGFIEGRNDASGLAAYFVRAAELEAASVAAFRGLRAELCALGAPRRLLRALSRAARDEQRHTRSTSALARRFGARPLPARVAPTAARSLEAIALENVAEGCVRELYGALVATFQAQSARDLQVKSAMARIAHEETRHAALSQELQRWLEQRLDSSARARLALKRRAAVRELSREIDAQPELERAEQAGLPTRQQARKLFDSLSGVLLAS